MTRTPAPEAAERAPMHRGAMATLNPLAPVAAALPVMVALLFTRTIATPLALGLLSLAIVIVSTRLTGRRALTLLVGLPALVAVLSVSFGVWTDAATVADTPVLLQFGGFRFYAGALHVGTATALRLGTLIVLALLCGVAADGPALVRSTVQHLHVPYRIGYTVLAGFRFVPRFGHELDLIRQAHRVRGMARGRSPYSALRRGFGYVVPLLAGAIRHAERVALAMDSRAFGAYPTRTERHPVPLRRRDGLFVTAFWLVSASVFVATATLP